MKTNGSSKKLLLAFCVITVTLVGILLTRHYKSVAASPKKQSVPVPEHVVYKHLFHHVMALKKKTEETEKAVKDATQFKTHYMRKAQLSEDENRVLQEVATQFAQDEELIAARAKPLVEAYKAQYPNGQVPHGQTPSKPPDELRKLSEERDAAVLRARDNLHARLGNERFNRFDNFVKTYVAANVEMH